MAFKVLKAEFLLICVLFVTLSSGNCNDTEASGDGPLIDEEEDYNDDLGSFEGEGVGINPETDDFNTWVDSFAKPELNAPKAPIDTTKSIPVDNTNTTETDGQEFKGKSDNLHPFQRKSSVSLRYQNLEMNMDNIEDPRSAAEILLLIYKLVQDGQGLGLGRVVTQSEEGDPLRLGNYNAALTVGDKIQSRIQIKKHFDLVDAIELPKINVTMVDENNMKVVPTVANPAAPVLSEDEKSESKNKSGHAMSLANFFF